MPLPPLREPGSGGRPDEAEQRDRGAVSRPSHLSAHRPFNPTGRSGEAVDRSFLTSRQQGDLPWLTQRCTCPKGYDRLGFFAHP